MRRRGIRLLVVLVALLCVAGVAAPVLGAPVEDWRTTVESPSTTLNGDLAVTAETTESLRVSVTENGAPVPATNATVEWQVVTGGHADATTPDDTAWQSLTASNGTWTADWNVPAVALPTDATLYVRAADGSGAAQVNAFDVTVQPNGRQFTFTRNDSLASVFGTVTVIDSGDGTNTLGISAEGEGLTPNETYSVTVTGTDATGAEVTHTVSFVAGVDGDGEVTYTSPTGLIDEFETVLTVTGIEFGVIDRGESAPENPTTPPDGADGAVDDPAEPTMPIPEPVGTGGNVSVGAPGWYNMSYANDTGRWTLDWNAPQTVDPSGYHGTLTVRTVTEGGDLLANSSAGVVLVPDGRVATFAGTNGTGSLTARVATAPIGTDGTEVIGVGFRGTELVDEGTYQLSVSGTGPNGTRISHNVSFVARDDGVNPPAGSVSLVQPTSLTNVSDLTLTVTGPGFGTQTAGPGQSSPTAPPTVYDPRTGSGVEMLIVTPPQQQLQNGHLGVEAVSGGVVPFDVVVTNDGATVTETTTVDGEDVLVQWRLSLAGSVRSPTEVPPKLPDGSTREWMPATYTSPGRYDADWDTPTTVRLDGRLERVDVRHLDPSGNVTAERSYIVLVEHDGIEFTANGTGDARLQGEVVVEPTGPDGTPVTAMRLSGRALTPGATYTLVVSGTAADGTVVDKTLTFVADGTGKGTVRLRPELTRLPVNESRLTIAVTGPGFEAGTMRIRDHDPVDLDEKVFFCRCPADGTRIELERAGLTLIGSTPGFLASANDTVRLPFNVTRDGLALGPSEGTVEWRTVELVGEDAPLPGDPIPIPGIPETQPPTTGPTPPGTEGPIAGRPVQVIDGRQPDVVGTEPPTPGEVPADPVVDPSPLPNGSEVIIVPEVPTPDSSPPQTTPDAVVVTPNGTVTSPTASPTSTFTATGTPTPSSSTNWMQYLLLAIILVIIAVAVLLVVRQRG